MPSRIQRDLNRLAGAVVPFLRERSSRVKLSTGVVERADRRVACSFVRDDIPFASSIFTSEQTPFLNKKSERSRKNPKAKAVKSVKTHSSVNVRERVIDEASDNKSKIPKFSQNWKVKDDKNSEVGPDHGKMRLLLEKVKERNGEKVKELLGKHGNEKKVKAMLAKHGNETKEALQKPGNEAKVNAMFQKHEKEAKVLQKHGKEAKVKEVLTKHGDEAKSGTKPTDSQLKIKEKNTGQKTENKTVKDSKIPGISSKAVNLKVASCNPAVISSEKSKKAFVTNFGDKVKPINSLGDDQRSKTKWSQKAAKSCAPILGNKVKSHSSIDVVSCRKGLQPSSFKSSEDLPSRCHSKNGDCSLRTKSSTVLSNVASSVPKDASHSESKSDASLLNSNSIFSGLSTSLQELVSKSSKEALPLKTKRPIVVKDPFVLYSIYKKKLKLRMKAKLMKRKSWIKANMGVDIEDKTSSESSSSDDEDWFQSCHSIQENDSVIVKEVVSPVQALEENAVREKLWPFKLNASINSSVLGKEMSHKSSFDNIDKVAESTRHSVSENQMSDVKQPNSIQCSDTVSAKLSITSNSNIVNVLPSASETSYSSTETIPPNNQSVDVSEKSVSAEDNIDSFLPQEEGIFIFNKPVCDNLKMSPHSEENTIVSEINVENSLTAQCSESVKNMTVKSCQYSVTTAQTRQQSKSLVDSGNSVSTSLTVQPTETSEVFLVSSENFIDVSQVSVASSFSNLNENAQMDDTESIDSINQPQSKTYSVQHKVQLTESKEALLVTSENSIDPSQINVDSDSEETVTAQTSEQSINSRPASPELPPKDPGAEVPIIPLESTFEEEKSAMTKLGDSLTQPDDRFSARKANQPNDSLSLQLANQPIDALSLQPADRPDNPPFQLANLPLQPAELTDNENPQIFFPGESIAFAENGEPQSISLMLIDTADAVEEDGNVSLTQPFATLLPNDFVARESEMRYCEVSLQRPLKTGVLSKNCISLPLPRTNASTEPIHPVRIMESPDMHRAVVCGNVKVSDAAEVVEVKEDSENELHFIPILFQNPEVTSTSVDDPAPPTISVHREASSKNKERRPAVEKGASKSKGGDFDKNHEFPTVTFPIKALPKSPLITSTEKHLQIDKTKKEKKDPSLIQKRSRERGTASQFPLVRSSKIRSPFKSRSPTHSRSPSAEEPHYRDHENREIKKKTLTSYEDLLQSGLSPKRARFAIAKLKSRFDKSRDSGSFKTKRSVELFRHRLSFKIEGHTRSSVRVSVSRQVAGSGDLQTSLILSELSPTQESYPLCQRGEEILTERRNSMVASSSECSLAPQRIIGENAKRPSGELNMHKVAYEPSRPIKELLLEQDAFSLMVENDFSFDLSEGSALPCALFRRRQDIDYQRFSSFAQSDSRKRTFSEAFGIRRQMEALKSVVDAEAQPRTQLAEYNRLESAISEMFLQEGYGQSSRGEGGSASEFLRPN